MTSYDIIVGLPDTTAVPIDLVNMGSKPFKTHFRTATAFKNESKLSDALPGAWKVQADICCRADNIGGKGLQEGPPDLSFFIPRD